MTDPERRATDESQTAADIALRASIAPRRRCSRCDGYGTEVSNSCFPELYGKRFKCMGCNGTGRVPAKGES